MTTILNILKSIIRKYDFRTDFCYQSYQKGRCFILRPQTKSSRGVTSTRKEDHWILIPKTEDIVLDFLFEFNNDSIVLQFFRGGVLPKCLSYPMPLPVYPDCLMNVKIQLNNKTTNDWSCDSNPYSEELKKVYQWCDLFLKQQRGGINNNNDEDDSIEEKEYTHKNKKVEKKKPMKATRNLDKKKEEQQLLSLCSHVEFVLQQQKIAIENTSTLLSDMHAMVQQKLEDKEHNNYEPEKENYFKKLRHQFNTTDVPNKHQNEISKNVGGYETQRMSLRLTFVLADERTFETYAPQLIEYSTIDNDIEVRIVKQPTEKTEWVPKPEYIEQIQLANKEYESAQQYATKIIKELQFTIEEGKGTGYRIQDFVWPTKKNFPHEWFHKVTKKDYNCCAVVVCCHSQTQFYKKMYHYFELNGEWGEAIWKDQSIHPNIELSK